jgi:hypothetical protein
MYLIKENQVIVTGTPQFEPHFDISLSQTRGIWFCAEYNLDSNKIHLLLW